ncbi:oligoendopeptidase F [Defluviitalea phaphyphila]|uniref:oligoendopeptidase F n=1 Tax=Defluviitalea phaphyphila TaxID=1473580 RepID=UPI00073114E7|nr:oligoendopeptidase F [Defluviitalea phaphyphila]
MKKRYELDKKFTWRLEDIYISDEDCKKDMKKLEDSLKDLSQFKGKLSQSSKILYDCLVLNDKLSLITEKIYVYSHMKLHEDTSNSISQGLADKAKSLSVKFSSASSFIIPEILSISEDILKKYIDENDDLKLYSHLINNLLRKKDHVLSKENEQLLAETLELGQSPQNIFSMLNNADITFPAIKDENGNEIEVTKGNFIHLMENPNRRIRHDAFKSLYSSYIKYKNTIAATYNASIKKDVFFARTRKYSSSLEYALFDDNIPVEVYNNLIDTVHEHLPLLHKYVSLKKRLLGLDEMHMYDLYTPLIKDIDMKIPYEKAMEIVKEGLTPLGEDYIKVLDEGFKSGWIDVYENEGKRSGAYSWGVYGTHPYVLLNYQDNINNLFTLAHEMGHAIHSYYSDANQPYVYAQYPIFLAEVASTVNETLLMRYLLNKTKDSKKRAYLLNHFLEQFRGTLFRQTMFAEFEKITHEMAEKGEPITANTLSTVYRNLNIKYYGNDIVIDPEIDFEWARIPHFYNAFYVYKYATGYSAAIALSYKIFNKEEGALDNYMTFLKSGGSDYPINILERAGVDMRTKEPIKQALKVFEELINEMEQQI